MSCQACGEREATRYVTEVVHGAKQRLALCDACADERQLPHHVGEIELYHLMTLLQEARTLEQFEVVQAMVGGPGSAREKMREALFGKAVEQYSGRFVLRLPKSVHAELAALADREGVSLNQLCLSILSRHLASR